MKFGRLLVAAALVTGGCTPFHALPATTDASADSSADSSADRAPVGDTSAPSPDAPVSGSGASGNTDAGAAADGALGGNPAGGSGPGSGGRGGSGNGMTGSGGAATGGSISGASGGSAGSGATAGAGTTSGGSATGGRGTGGMTGSGGAVGSGGQMCSATQHNCSGTCVDNNSILHCGGLCDPCTAPTGGTPTCDGTRCDFTCGTMRKCPTKCTTGCCADTDCPPMAGMAGRCDTSTNVCSYSCATGFKPCGTGTCIPMANCCTASDCAGTCRTCSAAGACVAVTNADDTDSCPGTCDATGACKSKRGQTCMTGNGCITGTTCAPDGICCNTACTNSCEACDIAGLVGTCTPVTSIHSGHAPCAGSGTCAGTCDGQSAMCHFPGAETTCRNATCTAGTATQAAVCNGAGSCPPPSTVSCSPSTCGVTTCIAMCSSNSQCVSGAACVTGVCRTCTGGQAVCPNACVDTSSDPSNCGACGRSCFGGTCSGGTCQPVSLGTLPTGFPDALFLSDGALYVTTGPTPGVWRLDPNRASDPVSVASNLFRFPRCIQNGRIFWVSADGGTEVPSPISVCSTSNCSGTTQLFTTSPGHIFSTQLDQPICDPLSAELVWFDHTTMLGNQLLNIYRAPDGGGAVRKITSVVLAGADSFLSLGFVGRRSDRFFYVAQTFSPAKETAFYVPANVLNLSPISIVSGVPGAGGVNVGLTAYANDTLFVWNDGSGSQTTTYSVPLPNGLQSGLPPVFYPGFLGGSNTMDNQNLYGTFTTLPADAIGRCPVSNCSSPSILFRGQQFAATFISDANSIYWTTPLPTQGFAVWKATK